MFCRYVDILSIVKTTLQAQSASLPPSACTVSTGNTNRNSHSENTSRTEPGSALPGSPRSERKRSFTVKNTRYGFSPTGRVHNERFAGHTNDDEYMGHDAGDGIRYVSMSTLSVPAALQTALKGVPSIDPGPDKYGGRSPPKDSTPRVTNSSSKRHRTGDGGSGRLTGGDGRSKEVAAFLSSKLTAVKERMHTMLSASRAYGQRVVQQYETSPGHQNNKVQGIDGDSRSGAASGEEAERVQGGEEGMDTEGDTLLVEVEEVEDNNKSSLLLFQGKSGPAGLEGGSGMVDHDIYNPEGTIIYNQQVSISPLRFYHSLTMPCDDDERTHTASASCLSLCSYIPHLPSPSPSFIISI